MCSPAYSWKGGHASSQYRLEPRFLSYLHIDKADSLKPESIDRVLLRKHRLHHASRHHDLPRLQPHAPGGQLRGKPGDGIEGMAEDVAAASFADRDTILGGSPEHGLEIRPFGREFRQHDAAVPGIVRDQRQHIEVAVIRAAIVDQLDGGA